MTTATTDDRLPWLRAVAVASAVVFAVGLVVGWWEGVDLGLLVLFLLSWCVLLAVCWWLDWAIRYRSRHDA